MNDFCRQTYAAFCATVNNYFEMQNGGRWWGHFVWQNDAIKNKTAMFCKVTQLIQDAHKLEKDELETVSKIEKLVHKKK